MRLTLPTLSTVLLLLPLVSAASDLPPPPMTGQDLVRRVERVLGYWCTQAQGRYGLAPTDCQTRIARDLPACIARHPIPAHIATWNDFETASAPLYRCAEPRRAGSH